MGMEIEMGNWFVPLIMSAAAFLFAALSSRQDSGTEMLQPSVARSIVLYGLASIASAACWFAWAGVTA